VRLAVLTPAADYSAEWAWAYDVEAAALAAAGMAVEPVPWTEDRDWREFDLILPLVAWGYHQRYAEWLALLDRFERDRLPVANPVPLLRWNGDKAYLAELAAKGVATVPTFAVDSLDEGSLAAARRQFGGRDVVVKPPVSASAYGTFRLADGDPLPDAVRGWRMLVQPWIEAILDSGEYSLMFFDGELSHAVSKVPKAGEFRVQPEYGGIIDRCDPPPGSEELARAALAAAPTAASYARVDIVVGQTGLQVIELELIEPALFLDHAPEAAGAFAGAVRNAARARTPIRRAS
jgi:glutathione synthase/RimK-type ligase-like ATP-grasp enzyme